MNVQNTNQKDPNPANKLTSALLIVYLIVLLWILVFKLGVRFTYMGERNVNLIPFGEPLRHNGSIDFSEMILNAVIFVPLGIYAGILLKHWTFKKNILLFFFISLVCEGLQFGLGTGAFDVTDLIINTLGGVVGWLLMAAIVYVLKSDYHAQKYVNIIATLVTIVMVVLLILLKLNLLPIRYQ